MAKPPSSLPLHRLEDLHARLYAASCFADLKREAARLVAEEIGADGSILLVGHADADGLQRIYHFDDGRCRAAQAVHMRERHSEGDLMLKVLRRRLAGRPYAVAATDRLGEREPFRNSPAYEEVYAPFGLRHMVSAAFSPMRRHKATLSFFRSSEARPFEEEAYDLVCAVAPAFASAMRRILLEQALSADPMRARPFEADFVLEDRQAGFWIDGEAIEAAAEPSTPATAVDIELDDIDRNLERLTPREHEIAALAARGLTNVQIARMTSISYRTVEIHVSSILRKLGLNNRTEIAYLITHSRGARGTRPSAREHA